MKIIFAQGNPGPDYVNTRHNIGFTAVDYFARKHNLEFSVKPKFSASIAELSTEDEKILLVKPSTYYNETGVSARALIDFYKLDAATDLLVIHDELALPFGTIRTRSSGSDAGNNGIKSLNAHLGEDYLRMRVGINTPHTELVGAHDFVLGRFTKEEQDQLDSTVLDKLADLIDQFIAGSLEHTTHS